MCVGGGGGGGELCKYFVTRSMFNFFLLCSEMCSVFMFFVKEANGLKTNKLSCSCSCCLCDAFRVLTNSRVS